MILFLTIILLFTSSAFAEPTFYQHNALQNPRQDFKPILRDIESHMTAGHQYTASEYGTWGHETTHGINSLLRNKLQREYKQEINCYYVLDGRYVVIKDLDTTIGKVAQNVPPSLRRAKIYTGHTGVYQLYLVDQRRDWDDMPSYLMDEWVAYCNGAEVNIEYADDSVLSDVINMLQFNVFTLSLAYTAHPDDEEFKEFIKWNLVRSFDITRRASQVANLNQANEYWKLVKYTEDAEELRQFTRDYLGKDWVKKNLGF